MAISRSRSISAVTRLFRSNIGSSSLATTAPKPKPTGPTRISSGVVSGLKVSGSTPTYPAIARAAHVGGSVVLHAIISKTGSIESLQVVSGSPMLQDSAMEAVKTWKYKPYLLNGEPTEVDTTITVNFNLSGG